ncbi:Uncharacterized protein Fot_20110 [Forsythia ovata]|uniref:Uncharacterized protein n=1 Tax=Forsythia ovata TaxID=205694 RepID=A0ABD1VMZ1_9LAMI
MPEPAEGANARPRGVHAPQPRSTPWVRLRHSFSVDDDPANTPTDHPPRVPNGKCTSGHKNCDACRSMALGIRHTQQDLLAIANCDGGPSRSILRSIVPFENWTESMRGQETARRVDRLA